MPKKSRKKPQQRNAGNGQSDQSPWSTSGGSFSFTWKTVTVQPSARPPAWHEDGPVQGVGWLRWALPMFLILGVSIGVSTLVHAENICEKVEQAGWFRSPLPEFHLVLLNALLCAGFGILGVLWSPKNKILAAIPDWFQLAIWVFIGLITFNARESVDQLPATEPVAEADGVDSSEVRHPDSNRVVAREGSAFRHQAEIHNRGTRTWRDRKICLYQSPIDYTEVFQHRCIPLGTVEPGRSRKIWIEGTAPRHAGVYLFQFKMEDQYGDLAFMDAKPLNLELRVRNHGN